jgi:hypothetical protein
VRFEVLAGLSVKVMVFWTVMPDSLVVIHLSKDTTSHIGIFYLVLRKTNFWPFDVI